MEQLFVCVSHREATCQQQIHLHVTNTREWNSDSVHSLNLVKIIKIVYFPETPQIKKHSQFFYSSITILTARTNKINEVDEQTKNKNNNNFLRLLALHYKLKLLNARNFQLLCFYQQNKLINKDKKYLFMEYTKIGGQLDQSGGVYWIILNNSVMISGVTQLITRFQRIDRNSIPGNCTQIPGCCRLETIERYWITL